jgi:hypothetical protein
MTNPFVRHNSGLTAPASKVVPVTPDDSTDLPDGVCRAVLVGSAGTANIIDASGVARTGVPLQQGINPIGIRRIKTGGTAANLWALY